MSDTDYPAACVVGASIICVDILVRLIPSQRKFRIQDSNAFLACSLSLSFGVMVTPTPSPAVHAHAAASRGSCAHSSLV